MKINRFSNNTSTHSLDDLSSILIDLQIAEFIAKATQLNHDNEDNKEVAA